MARKQALGKGLRALIPDTPRARSGLAEIPVSVVRPNPGQPRTRFDPAAMRELAASIREHGVLQPLLVSEDPEGGYILIAGERRLRAAREAGLKTVPAVIRERLGEQREIELALVENLQRRDLSPLEEARAFEQLRSEMGLTQAEIAARVGVDRSTVANALRLLKLSPAIQELVESGQLTAGHARAILAFPAEDRERWAERAAGTGMSVRELERESTRTDAGRSRKKQPAPPDPNLRAAEERLGLRLGARVSITARRRGGRIVITCSSQEELQRVYDAILGGSHGTPEH